MLSSEELRRLVEEGRMPADAEELAHGAQFWATLKEAEFPAASVLPLTADIIRQDYRATDMTSLAREMVARREDLATATRIEALRQAIRRGERVERLLPARDAQRPPERPERVEPQPAPERPQRDRPERQP